MTDETQLPETLTDATQLSFLFAAADLDNNLAAKFILALDFLNNAKVALEKARATADESRCSGYLRDAKTKVIKALEYYQFVLNTGAEAHLESLDALWRYQQRRQEHRRQLSQQTVTSSYSALPAADTETELEPITDEQPAFIQEYAALLTRAQDNVTPLAFVELVKTNDSGIEYSDFSQKFGEMLFNRAEQLFWTNRFDESSEYQLATKDYLQGAATKRRLNFKEVFFLANYELGNFAEKVGLAEAKSMLQALTHESLEPSLRIREQVKVLLQLGYDLKALVSTAREAGAYDMADAYYHAAFRCFYFAAKENNTEGAYWTGYCYLKGHGIGVEYHRAYHYFQVSRRLDDNLDAIAKIAFMQKTGKGQPKGHPERDMAAANYKIVISRLLGRLTLTKLAEIRVIYPEVRTLESARYQADDEKRCDDEDKIAQLTKLLNHYSNLLIDSGKGNDFDMHRAKGLLRISHDLGDEYAEDLLSWMALYLDDDSESVIVDARSPDAIAPTTYARHRWKRAVAAVITTVAASPAVKDLTPRERLTEFLKAPSDALALNDFALNKLEVQRVDNVELGADLQRYQEIQFKRLNSETLLKTFLDNPADDLRLSNFVIDSLSDKLANQYLEKLLEAFYKNTEAYRELTPRENARLTDAQQTEYWDFLKTRQCGHVQRMKSFFDTISAESDGPQETTMAKGPKEKGWKLVRHLLQAHQLSVPPKNLTVTRADLERQVVDTIQSHQRLIEKDSDLSARQLKARENVLTATKRRSIRRWETKLTLESAAREKLAEELREIREESEKLKGQIAPIVAVTELRREMQLQWDEMNAVKPAKAFAEKFKGHFKDVFLGASSVNSGQAQGTDSMEKSVAVTLVGTLAKLFVPLPLVATFGQKLLGWAYDKHSGKQRERLAGLESDLDVFSERIRVLTLKLMQTYQDIIGKLSEEGGREFATATTTKIISAISSGEFDREKDFFEQILEILRTPKSGLANWFDKTFKGVKVEIHGKQSSLSHTYDDLMVKPAGRNVDAPDKAFFGVQTNSDSFGYIWLTAQLAQSLKLEENDSDGLAYSYTSSMSFPAGNLPLACQALSGNGAAKWVAAAGSTAQSGAMISPFWALEHQATENKQAIHSLMTLFMQFRIQNGGGAMPLVIPGMTSETSCCFGAWSRRRYQSTGSA